MKYFKKINGERVYLSPMNVGDVEIYTKWMNDVHVSGGLGNYRKMISLITEKKDLETMAAGGHNYAIVLHDDDTLIGNLGLFNIDQINQTGTLGIFIGEAKYRNQGYGSEAASLIVDYGFNVLNLHNIMLEAHSNNEMAISSYKRVGFNEFGRRKEAQFVEGRRRDIVCMEILAQQFRK